MYFLQSSWQLPWSPIVTVSDASPLHTLCVLGSGLNGRVLERSHFKWNPGSSARDSFFQANDFVKNADGLWHPRVVELRLLQKAGLACSDHSEMENRSRHPVVRGTRSFSWFAVDGVCRTSSRNATNYLYHRQHVLCRCF